MVRDQLRNRRVPCFVCLKEKHSSGIVRLKEGTSSAIPRSV